MRRVAALVRDRLIDQRVDGLSMVPADRSGRGREVNQDEVFLWIGPPVGAARAGPDELPDRSHPPRDAGRGTHGEPETEAEIGAGWIGIADEIPDVGPS